MRTTFLATIWACGAAGSPASSPPRPEAASREEAVASSAQGQTSPPEEVSSPEVRAVPRIALGAISPRAEWWVGETQLIRFAERGADKATLGGWHSGILRKRVAGGMFGAARRRARIYARAESPPSHLSIYGRALRDGPVRVFVNGRAAGEGVLPREGGRLTFALPEDTWQQGENSIELRARPARGSGKLDGIALLLEAVTLGADPVVPLDAASIGEGALHLGTSASASWWLTLPPGARLRGRLRGSGLVLEGRRDNEAPTQLGPFPPGALDVDLSALGTESLELRLRAGDQALSLEAPTLVTLEQGAPEREAAAQTVRNVLLLLVDTLRADKLAPYDPETRVRTPGLRRFVASASVFEHAHAQENWTKPSVATLLSSLMPWEHTATQHASVLPRSVELLPERLQQQGLYTGAFIANGFVSDRFGFRRGWDTYRNYIREHRRTPAQYVAADVLAWLDERPEEAPFFLYVHTIDPHVPYRPPREFVEMYGDPRYQGPVQFGRDPLLLENIKRGRLRLRARDREHLVALYDGEISYHDVHFRAILDGLSQRGLDDDTMVIVTSDHGEELFDHGSVGHGHSVYEELLHVPLFVRMPGARSLRRITTPVGLVDVMPTILEALGLERPPHLSGRSFLPALRGEEAHSQRGTISGFMENWRTFTDGRFKLVQRPGNRSRLYDLESDPGEELDIAAEHPLLVHALRGRLGLAQGRTHRDTQARRRRPHRPEATPIDAETEAQLRALGYTE